MARVVCGVFVGGASSRMGEPKGLLRHGGETLVARAVRVAREAGLAPCLIGDASPYVGLVPEVPRIADAPAGIGPLGGLRALLAVRAREWATDSGSERPSEPCEPCEHVVSLAVDMPFVDVRMLRAMVAHPSEADVLLPRRAVWEPLCARWSCVAVPPVLDTLLDEGERSLQRLVGRLRAEELVVPPAQLDDWDTPADVRRPR